MKLQRKNNFRENRLLKHSITDYKSLDSFMKNLHYVNQRDFREEAITIGEILDLFIINGEYNQARIFFRNDILDVGNENKLKTLLAMLYTLKEKYFDKLEIIIFLQELLSYLLISEFRIKTEFNLRLSRGGLNLREFLDVRYKDKFKEEIDEDWIEKYKALIDNSLNSLSKICSFILEEVNISDDQKKLYLESYLSELNQVLSYNRTLTKYDFPDSVSEEIKEKKINLIEEAKDIFKKIKVKFLFLILYKIDQGQLPRDFFELAYKLYSSGDISSELDKPINPLSFNDLEWLNYDTFIGGAQSIPWFNYNKYRLLIIFYNYLKSNRKETGIKKLSNDNFMGSISDIEKELSDLQMDFIKKYLSFNENDFNTFKKNSLKDIKTRKKEVKKLEEDYIQKSNLEDKYINQFKEDCFNVWEEKQRELSEIFEFTKIKKDSKNRLFFGQNKLSPKEWFLEPFDKHVGMSRDSGKDFGRDQAESKYRKILEEVSSMFKKSKGDKEIKIKDLYNDLINNIEDGKSYYLFYTGREIYDIPNMEWERTGISVAKLKIKNSIVHFCYSRIKEILLLEKNSFKLKQYLDKDGKELFIDVNKDFTGEETKQILETNKNLKTKEDLKKYVKIKILEKFEIERNKKYKIKRLII